MAQDSLDVATEATASTTEKPFEFSWDSLLDKAYDWGLSLAIAIAILVIGFFIAKRISKLIGKILDRKDFDESLKRFLMSLVNVTLRILIVVTALGELGLEMTSFIALIAAAGLAIGMAFSGTLGNFAGGIMILIFRPYKVGDYVGAQGEEGSIEEIQIFNTILLTVDNKTIIVPNGAMANGNITNFTTQKQRRVDFVIGIGYGDDYKKAKEVLSRFISEDDKILKDPAPFIGLGELADSSVNITLRVWSTTEDYWDVYFRMNERVYNEFEKEGLSIPYPQMDVHVHNS